MIGGTRRMAMIASAAIAARRAVGAIAFRNVSFFTDTGPVFRLNVLSDNTAIGYRQAESQSNDSDYFIADDRVRGSRSGL